MADAELVKDFVLESLDFLDKVEPSLIELQQAAEATGEIKTDTVNLVFRLFHSLKGGAGMLELNNIATLTHTAETMLELFRTNKLVIKPNHIELLFATTDLIRKMLTAANEQLLDQGFEQQVETLVASLESALSSPAAPEKVSPGQNPPNYDDLDFFTPQASPLSAPTPKIDEPVTKKPTASDLEIPITAEMLERFVQESYDLLDEFESSLLRVEKAVSQQSTDPNAASSAFRVIHSFKGNCGFMGLSDLETLSHRMETILDYLKSGTINTTPEVTQLLLSWIDLLRFAVADAAKGGAGKIDNCSSYICTAEEMIVKWILDNSQPSTSNTPLPTKTEATPQVPTVSPSKTEIVRQDLRVDLRKLDSLVNLVGELVIAEAMLTRHPALSNHEDEGVERAIHHLRRISRDLQDVAMSVRMIPLATTFQKMIRLVHDLAHKAGKKVNLELHGEETEVDKTVIEHIADPLVHIVRNALDHGIEPPEERLKAGKPESGSLKIEGRHEGGEVWITIRDDGRGLNREKILQKAIAQGLIQGNGEGLSDSQIFKLIFEPGFSTAEKVTDISGRGVGMDVVKKNLEKLKGRIDVQSRLGYGTTFILRIPLTLAIIEGMLVRVGENCYTIPLLGIRESLRPALQQITITPDGHELVKVRGEFFPILRLNRIFRKDYATYHLEDGILVLVESEGQLVALLVDEILGQQETVIKGLSGYLSKARGISGCTILGNGEISMIIDIGTLVSTVRNPLNITGETSMSLQ